MSYLDTLLVIYDCYMDGWDGLNDLSMIKAAGIGVAMGNACREAIENADYVTLSCDDDGVAATIEKYFFNNSNYE